ncbi:hypothetical protein ACLB2K_026570 [Fragaria x ananassa]
MIRYDYNLTSINTTSTWYDDEPFILATEAQQVFYLDDYKLGSHWKVVQKLIKQVCMLIGSAMTKRTRLQTANQSCQNSAEDGLNSTTAVTIERTTTGTRVSTRLHHQIVNDQPVRNAITEERNDNVMSDINQEPPSGPTKKVRGKTRGVNADKVFSQLNSKLPVTLTEQNGRPTGPYAEMFANEIGYTIRNHAPLNVEKWKKINKVDVDNMIKRMQIRSEKNVINRSQLKHHHKAGSKSFMSHQEQIAAQTGEIQGAIDRFETEYKSTKKGWDLGAKAKWDAMIKMRTETTEPDGTRTMTDDEICEKVLGVKSGYIKGWSSGTCWELYIYISDPKKALAATAAAEALEATIVSESLVRELSKVCLWLHIAWKRLEDVHDMILILLQFRELCAHGKGEMRM